MPITLVETDIVHYALPEFPSDFESIKHADALVVRLE